MSIRFYDFRGNEILGEFASVDATEVRVFTEFENASFMYSELFEDWVIVSHSHSAEYDEFKESYWESWQDAVHEVMGLDCSVENPI
jgi:hypothetical protein